MIVITGGAGFIGSNLVSRLVRTTDTRIIVVDRLGLRHKWKNLRNHAIHLILLPHQFHDWLSDNSDNVDIIFHLGSSNDDNLDQSIESNLQFTLQLWHICSQYGIRFIYASSFATYGDGSLGFDDNLTVEQLCNLRPLSSSAWFKHLLDINFMRLQDKPKKPSQWVGLKFFNVYGPNEYHKDQASIVYSLFRQIKSQRSVKLYKSHRVDFEHGEYKRDLVWVDDCIEVLLWLYDNPQINGIYNCGSGEASSLNGCAEIIFSALDSPSIIEYTSMPPEVQAHYQYYTKASLHKLRESGYDRPFTPLESGIKRYLYDFLMARSMFR